MQALLFSLYAALAVANPLDKRDTITSVVNLSNHTGKPAHLASGFIYGIPDTPNQIPDHFFTDIDFNYARAVGLSCLGSFPRQLSYSPDILR